MWKKKANPKHFFHSQNQWLNPSSGAARNQGSIRMHLHILKKNMLPYIEVAWPLFYRCECMCDSALPGTETVSFHGCVYSGCPGLSERRFLACSVRLETESVNASSNWPHHGCTSVYTQKLTLLIHIQKPHLKNIKKINYTLYYIFVYLCKQSYINISLLYRKVIIASHQSMERWDRENPQTSECYLWLTWCDG